MVVMLFCEPCAHVKSAKVMKCYLCVLMLYNNKECRSGTSVVANLHTKQ